MLCVPPTVVEAEYFERQMLGRNRSILVGARGEDGAPVRAIVKLDARLERPPAEHLHEWIASALARRLGVDTPAPLAVRITLPFALAITDDATARDAARSTGTAFGSEYAGPGFTQWKSDDELPVDLRELAAEVLVFDVLVHNFDRRRENPNVLTNRTRVVAIDHDLAFAFLDPPVLTDPVRDPLAQLRDRHIFGRSFSSRMVFSTTRVRDAIAALDDAFFDALREATPQVWTEGLAASRLERTISTLRQRRDAVDHWLPLVNAWMRM